MSWGGVEACNDSMVRIGNMEDLKREEWTKDAITELKSLFRGKRIERNSAGNSEISGSLAGRIAKQLIGGKEKKSDADLKSGNKESANRFAKQANSKRTESSECKTGRNEARIK